MIWDNLSWCTFFFSKRGLRNDEDTVSQLAWHVNLSVDEITGVPVATSLFYNSEPRILFLHASEKKINTTRFVTFPLRHNYIRRRLSHILKQKNDPLKSKWGYTSFFYVSLIKFLRVNKKNTARMTCEGKWNEKNGCPSNDTYTHKKKNGDVWREVEWESWLPSNDEIKYIYYWLWRHVEWKRWLPSNDKKKWLWRQVEWERKLPSSAETAWKHPGTTCMAACPARSCTHR